MLNVKNKKVYLPLIVALSLAIACGAIACGIIFWPKKPLQKTTQEWLNDFKRSFSVIELANIDAEQPARLNVARAIVIKEEGQAVAEYAQTLQISNSESGAAAYLTVEEKFPLFETKEFDFTDEYYLSGGVMYTRRISKALRSNLPSAMVLHSAIVLYA